MNNVIMWIVVAVVSLSLLVSIASGIGFIVYITRASRQAKKQRKLEKIETARKNAALFELFKAEMKKRGFGNEKK